MALKMKAHECHGCEKRLLLASGYCPQCRSKQSFFPIEVEGVGEVFSYTIVRVSEERFSEETPYPVAVIEMGGGLRILGRLDQLDLDSLHIGMKVQLSEYKGEIPFFKTIV